MRPASAGAYHRFCIGSSINKVELPGVKAPSNELRDTFLVEPIGREEEMNPHDIQGARPNGGTPVIENVCGL